VLATRPQTRFLLRGSLLLILVLVLWWFLLLNPLLLLLRGTGEFFGSLVFGADSRGLITETASKDWSFRMPMDVVVANAAQRSLPAQIHSLEFDILRSDLIAFTFSLPVFWAVFLAAPDIRRHWRGLALGSLLVILLETILLLLFVETSARNVAAELSQSQSGAEKWLLHVIDYLAVNVIPYLGPFIIALALHPALRVQVLAWSGAEPAKNAEASIISERKLKRAH